MPEVQRISKIFSDPMQNIIYILFYNQFNQVGANTSNVYV